MSPMTPFRADLHCHSTCSDGAFSPEELVRHALQCGLSGLSITDHDTAAAYETVLPLAQASGLKMISGTEFSTAHEGSTIHVLGYAFQLNHPAIQNFCEKHHARRESRNKAILEKLNQQRLPIRYDDLLKAALESNTKTIGRPHIALAMMKKGYVESLQQAFKKYLGESGACYVQGKSYSAAETIETIHAAKGFAVIAHPHLISSPAIVRSLLKLPFDGMECYYAKFHAHQNEPWLAIARQKNWLITGGSDFHGSIKPMIPLGCSWTPEETFQILEERFKKNHGL